MKKRLIKNLLLVLTMVVLCFAVGVMASAEDRAIIDSGECGAQGDNVIWTLYDDGELVISGEGAMEDMHDFELCPWYSYSTEIFSVKIEFGVTTIGTCAFYGLPIKYVEIAESVSNIVGLAFGECLNLEEVVIPEGVVNLGEGTFNGCLSLSNVTVPNSVIHIDCSVFKNCKSLQSIFIPASVSYIGEGVFEGCNNLEVVTLHSNIKQIGHASFVGCDNLKDVYYLGSEKEWNEINIYGDNVELFSADIHFNHEHSYNIEVLKEPTHLMEGKGLYSCVCGYFYIEAISKLEEHSYIIMTTNPTCTEKGYATYICECGYSYIDDYLNEVGHIDGDNDTRCDKCSYQIREKNLAEKIKDLIQSFIELIMSLFKK